MKQPASRGNRRSSASYRCRPAEVAVLLDRSRIEEAQVTTAHPQLVRQLSVCQTLILQTGAPRRLEELEVAQNGGIRP